MKAKKYLAGLTASCMMLMTLLGGTASADSVTVTADRLNIREKATTSSKAVDIVSRNDTLSFVSECGKWYQVKYSGGTGFVSSEYVSLDSALLAADVAANTEEMSAAGRTTDSVNMRELPTTRAKALKVLPRNANVTVKGRCGEWYLAEYGGKTGYITGEYLTVASDGTGDAGASGSGDTGSVPDDPSSGGSTDTGANQDIIYAAAKSGKTTVRVNLRSAATTDSQVVRVLNKGVSVSMTGENGSWYKVTAGEYAGYISKTYVTPVSESAGGAQTGETIYASAVPGKTTTGVNMRAAATTNSSVLKVLGRGTEISVLGENGGFYKIEQGGRTGYASKDYVQLIEDSGDAGTPSGETIYAAAKNGVTTVTVNMRREPEGEVLHTLPANTKVTLTGENGVWYKVTYGNSTGYISKSYISIIEESTGGSETTGGALRVTAQSLNMRRGPGTGYSIIKVLTYGKELTFYSLEDGWYYVSVGGDTGYVSAKYVTTVEPGSSGSGSGDDGEIDKVILSDWFKGEVADVFARGDTATVTDVKTGLKFRIKRTGGYYHADAQPLTKDDTKIMYQVYGNEWQWTRRAIWVTVDGKTFAASMNGMPHGETDSMPDNGFDGCFCVHFLNSMTHAGSRVDSGHQTCVREAYNAGNR